MKLLITFSFLLSLFCTGLAFALKHGTLLSTDEDQAAILADHLLVQAIERGDRAAADALPRNFKYVRKVRATSIARLTAIAMPSTRRMYFIRFSSRVDSQCVPSARHGVPHPRRNTEAHFTQGDQFL